MLQQRGSVERHDADLEPIRVRTPEPRVEGLPVVQAVARAVRHSTGPGLVRAHQLRGAVRVGDHELADEAGLVPVTGLGASVAELASVPAVAEEHLDVYLPV